MKAISPFVSVVYQTLRPLLASSQEVSEIGDEELLPLFARALSFYALA
jgi:hypothetical protein